MKSLWIWPFELEEKIGEGGMGVVYRGRFVKNDRRVAVKLLPAEITNPTILARFEREVQLLKDLKHPHIVHSFGGVCEDQRRFYAMELVEGGTLDDLLASRGDQLPWEQVVELGLQMCSALQYAHERKIVHRDVKPGNFLVTKSGKLKLSDFGLATLTSGSELTSDGRTVGSFRYMSPEQIRGTKEPLPSSDLYSLGCVLFKMLTGSPPFDGHNAGALLNQHLTATPPRVVETVPECPASLDKLVSMLLSKKPENRPADAREVARILKSVSPVSILGETPTADITRPGLRVQLPAESRSAPAVPSESKSKRISPLIVTTTLLVLALIILGLLLVRSGGSQAEEMWIAAYQDKKNSTEIRTHAAITLGKLAADNANLTEILERGLSDDNPRIRRASAEALGHAGDNGRAVLTSLLNLQKKDDNPQVRIAASESIQKIRSAPESSSSWKYFVGTVVILGLGIGGYLFYLSQQTSRG
ncbi:MAG: hypothetical protein Tsb009_20880 [Planctomycetaceae bacterium]